MFAFFRRVLLRPFTTKSYGSLRRSLIFATALGTAWSLSLQKKMYLTTQAESSQHNFIEKYKYSSSAEAPHLENFLSFATIEFRNDIFMTPTDFVRCFLSRANYGTSRRLEISGDDVDALLRATPRFGSSKTLFKDLGNKGLISFSDYMFLMCLLTHPQNSLRFAFQMFDRDLNEELDLREFKKISKIFADFCTGSYKPSVEDENSVDTTLMRHFFGKSGKRKLTFEGFSKFVANFKIEMLKYEFDMFSCNQNSMSPFDLARSLLHFANSDAPTISRGLSRIRSNSELLGKSICFEDYKLLYDFLFVLDDFASAIRMFLIAKHAISRDEFQRAARAVVGKTLNPVVLDTIFTLFDADGDGHLSSSEFIEAIRSRRLSSRYSTNSRLEAFRQCVRKAFSS